MGTLLSPNTRTISALEYEILEVELRDGALVYMHKALVSNFSVTRGKKPKQKRSVGK